MVAAGDGDQPATWSQFPWLATDEIPDALAEHWQEPAIAPGTLAMLQYTSGSTSQPKGVMLSHANLMANVHAIHQAFGVRSGDSSVFWLPMYHDMGLVGGVLVPLFAGATNVSISPATFLQSPITWLAAISKYRATISGGPNFAYDLCMRQITSEQHATLDRCSWPLPSLSSQDHRRAASHPRPVLLRPGLHRRRTH
jgi:acyl-CoA synthetase (AMP-forming)/AMP-acid ligase II